MASDPSVMLDDIKKQQRSAPKGPATSGQDVTRHQRENCVMNKEKDSSKPGTSTSMP
jgi:hypothetical protein